MCPQDGEIYKNAEDNAYVMLADNLDICATSCHCMIGQISLAYVRRTWYITKQCYFANFLWFTDDESCRLISHGVFYCI
jgi:hypothetical protein